MIIEKVAIMDKSNNRNMFLKYSVLGFFLGYILGGVPLFLYTKDSGDMKFPGYLGFAIGVGIAQKKANKQ